MSKYSLRVELSATQERKLKTASTIKLKPMTDIIKDYIDTMPSPITEDLKEFSDKNPMLIRKLEYWANKRNACDVEVYDYITELVFTDSVEDANQAIYKWRDRLSGQELAALLKYLPHDIYTATMMQTLRGNKAGSWYNTETGDYTTASEPIIKEFDNGVITLNAYSAFILNAKNMMIVDVDTSTDELINVMSPVITDNRNLALGVLDAFVKENPTMGFRVYDTACGLRYICTTHTFEPSSKESDMAMKSLLCDPRYAALCRKQGTYRARLTPKPWRVYGLDVPDKLDDVEWHEEYRVCQYVKTVGNNYIHTDFKDLIAEHDAVTAALDTDDLSYC